MLAVVIIAAVVGPPALGLGAQVAGVAAPVPIPGMPAVGDCLLEPPEAAGSALTSFGIAIAAAPTGTCPRADDDDQAFGEIVSVAPTMARPDGSDALDPQACRQPVRDYLGWTAGPWDPVMVDTVVLVGPDRVQYAGGQRWWACAVTTGSHGYRGSVRDGYGRAADLFGQCQDLRLGERSHVACHDPHTAEVFGSAVVGADGLADLTDTCTTLVRQRTGMSDPTAGGTLAVRAGPFDPNTVPPDVSAGGQSMTCSLRVVGDGLLVASLVGIGDRPLPWS